MAKLTLTLFILLSRINIIYSSYDKEKDGIFDGNDEVQSKNRKSLHFLKINSQYGGKAIEEEIQCTKLKLWQYGEYELDESFLFPRATSPLEKAYEMNRYYKEIAAKSGPIKKMRSSMSDLCNRSNILRGGGSKIAQENRIDDMIKSFGPDFEKAIHENIEEHEADCKLSCQYYYCANSTSKESLDSSNIWNAGNEKKIISYSMGAVPPEDFSSQFGFPLDLIKVTKGKALFHADEASNIIRQAEEEGLSNNEYRSGKYKLGGNYLTKLPLTRNWFNSKLKTIFFPLIAELFPEIVSSTSTLRAHSVSLLKYNSSHPRTDVHIDNGILAMTVSMTPRLEYQGGGTYFEHMGEDNIIQMDVGHGTFRPGSVRHGGHRVVSGTRYILGAFLLLTDRVEHVRRLKNKGSNYRKKGDLDKAEKYFQWALAINPNCTTCLKDWAEILLTKKHFDKAEEKLRKALDLLEQKDSDALFTLGIILSEQNKEEESIDAYLSSFSLNAQDAELCYNLGMKLGSIRGDVEKEIEMYEKATAIEETFGGAWINWGTILAERGQLDEAEEKFKKALRGEPEIIPKALMNIALVYQARANSYATSGKLKEAKVAIDKASEFLENTKPLIFEASVDNDFIKNELKKYESMFNPLRLQVHKLKGQILAGSGDLPACEEEFKLATKSFPNEASGWDMLARILELQGKTDEAREAKQKGNMLRSVGNMFAS